MNLDFKGIWLTNIEGLVVNIEGFLPESNIWVGKTVETKEQIIVNKVGYGKYKGVDLCLLERPRYPHPLAGAYQSTQ